MENIFDYFVHPDDKGVELEGQELWGGDVEDADEDTWPQTDDDVQTKWQALMCDDWLETSASALVPVKPGDDPAAVAAAEDSIYVRKRPLEIPLPSSALSPAN